MTHHSDGAYAVYDLTIDCARRGATLALDYELFFARDPQHRGLLRAPDADGEHLEVFSAARRHLELALPEARRARGHLLRAIREGVHHIWTGYDHMLFLIALLLPAVLRREERAAGSPSLSLRASVIEVLKIVTAFTAAHSVTLSLAALGFLSLPSRLVESAIAASVVLAALNNLVPVVRADRWLAAFALGLLHGFGFSATLTDLGLSRAALLPTLIGFNLGVEIGQAAVVARVLRRSRSRMRRVTLYRLWLPCSSARPPSPPSSPRSRGSIERAFGVTSSCRAEAHARVARRSSTLWRVNQPAQTSTTVAPSWESLVACTKLASVPSPIMKQATASPVIASTVDPSFLSKMRIAQECHLGIA